MKPRAVLFRVVTRDKAAEEGGAREGIREGVEGGRGNGASRGVCGAIWGLRVCDDSSTREPRGGGSVAEEDDLRTRDVELVVAVTLSECDAEHLGHLVRPV